MLSYQRINHLELPGYLAQENDILSNDWGRVKKRLVSLLPKAEYQYLFPNIMETNFSAIKMEDMPLVLFLGKSSISSNPRSTIGTHTGVFKEIRNRLADEFHLSPEMFSFNNALGWCPACKGRGTTKM